MTAQLPSALADIAGLNVVVNEVARLHAERARLVERLAAAEGEFIRRVAVAHAAGELDWWGLVAAYDMVREWSKTNGLGGFTVRWGHHVRYDRATLVRYAEAMPDNEDGIWTGYTGWDGLDGCVYPPRGLEVAFVLFGNGGVPVHIGQTGQFRPRLKALHEAGLVWESWLAQMCDGRHAAGEVKRELIKKYGKPNVAALPPHATLPA